jgi:RNA polymerase sigma factor (TIGR02999 family)
MMPLVYRRLKEISGHLLRGEWGEPHLETTALVHETYFRLIALERIDWKDRSHFFAMCARMMRRVLVDHARSRLRSKRGGQARRVETAELRNIGTERSPDLVELDRALASLAEHDKERAQIVELRFFGGLDREEIAQVMGISSATVTRRWRSARAWLINYLGRA